MKILCVEDGSIEVDKIEGDGLIVKLEKPKEDVWGFE